MAEALAFHVLQQFAIAMAGETIKAAGSTVATEISLLTQVQSSMDRIKCELEVMEAFLNNIKHRENNKTMEPWLKRVRKILYRCEDVIDEYVHLIGEHSKSGITNYFRKTIKRTVSVGAWLQIASQTKEIENDLHHVLNMKERYDINTKWGESSNLGSNIKRQLHVAGASYFTDENEIIGFVEERENLIEWLTDAEPSRNLISVLGMGGLGKTTIVSSVYKSQSVRRHFNCQAWVSVSRTYRTEDLMRRLLYELLDRKESVQYDIDAMDYRTLGEMLHGYLQNKRYMIVLDDIWSRDVWFVLDDAFPKTGCGSRIVITTRSKNLSSLAPSGYTLELRSLKEKEAWDLFCRKAFPNEADRSCPLVLTKWAQKIVDKCKGLPLAIVSLGSLLSFRGNEEIEWINFYHQLAWELNNNPELTYVVSILNLSFNDLPGYLKSCFLFCSIFPEDHLIKRKRLIRLWVAEGFVEERGPNKAMEEVAQGYLDELIHRSMLQVVERNEYGRVQSCQMHDLVRELTRSISRKENFSTVCKNTEEVELDNEVRRLVLQGREDLNTKWKGDLSRLRSYVGFNSNSSSLLSTVASTSKFLRVLELRGASIDQIADAVTDLFNLHYLGLRYTMVKEIPKSIGKLTRLQTLDLYHSQVGRLPQAITKLKKMRHLFVELILDNTHESFNSISGAETCKEIWNLRNLQTLQSLKADVEMVQNLGNLTQLTSLRLTDVRSSICPQLWSSLAMTSRLYFLHVMMASNMEQLLLTETFNPPPQLTKLELHGRLKENVVPTLCNVLCKVKWLSLSWSQLTEDPLPSLSQMPDLAFLNLQRVYEGHRLRFRAGWFPKLRTLYIKDMPELISVEIENGALASLNCLELVRLTKLSSVPPGIKFLFSLKKLLFMEMHQGFLNGLLGKRKTNVEHIPQIKQFMKIGDILCHENLSSDGVS